MAGDRKGKVWVVEALNGLGMEMGTAMDVAETFELIRTLPEPDALQVFLGVVVNTVAQAGANPEEAKEVSEIAARLASGET